MGCSGNYAPPPASLLVNTASGTAHPQYRCFCPLFSSPPCDHGMQHPRCTQDPISADLLSCMPHRPGLMLPARHNPRIDRIELARRPTAHPLTFTISYVRTHVLRPPRTPSTKKTRRTIPELFRCCKTIKHTANAKNQPMPKTLLHPMGTENFPRPTQYPC